jgi:hypothetical protein
MKSVHHLQQEAVEELRELERRAEVVKAFIQGEQIEFICKRHSRSKWGRVHSPTWKWDEWDYRIEHKPVVGWVCVLDGHCVSFSSDSAQPVTQKGHWVKVQQVEE